MASASRSVATATCAPAACARAMKPFRSSSRPVSSGYCTQRAEDRAVEVHRVGRPHAQLDAERFGAAAQHVQCLREHAVRHQEHAGVIAKLLALHAVQQRHRLAAAVASSSSEALATSIPVRSRHHGLEVEQRLQAALGDLGLVRRVGRVPAGILEHAALDHAGRERVVIAEADVTAADAVLAGEAIEPREIGGFAFRGRQGQRLRQADTGGHDLVDQRVERGGANGLEHRVTVRATRTDVAGSESVQRFEGGAHLASSAS